MKFKNLVFLAFSAFAILAFALATPRICGAVPQASSVESKSNSDGENPCPKDTACTNYSVPSGKTAACYTGVCDSTGKCIATQKADDTFVRTKIVDFCKDETMVCKDGVETPSGPTATNNGLACNTAPEDGNVCTNPGCSNGSCIADQPSQRPTDGTVQCQDSVTTDCQTRNYSCRGGGCTADAPINKGTDTSCDDITDDAAGCDDGEPCDGICTVRGCDGSGSCIQDAPLLRPGSDTKCGPTVTTECKDSGFACENGTCKQTETFKAGACSTLSDGSQVQTGECFRDPVCNSGLCVQSQITCEPSTKKCKANQCDKTSPTGCTEVDITPCCGNGVVEGPDETCDDDTPECKDCKKSDCNLDCDDSNPCSDDFCFLDDVGNPDCLHIPNGLSCCDGLDVIPNLECPPSRIDDGTSGPIHGGNGSVNGGGMSGGGVSVDPLNGGGVTGGGTGDPGGEDPNDKFCRLTIRCPLISTQCPDPNAKDCPACNPDGNPAITENCYDPDLYLPEPGTNPTTHKITKGGPVIPKAKRGEGGTVIMTEEGGPPECGCVCKYQGPPDAPCGGGVARPDPCAKFIANENLCNIDPAPWKCYLQDKCPPDKFPPPYCCRQLTSGI